MARVCVDACFIIGLYDESDQFHSLAVNHFEALFGEASPRHQLVAPWPILYECCGTRQAKSPRKTATLRQRWTYLSLSGRLVLLDDSPYRETPLDDHLGETFRPLSLVDRVLRAMILDSESPIDWSNNTGDFADACLHRGMTLINEKITPDSYYGL